MVSGNSVGDSKNYLTGWEKRGFKCLGRMLAFSFLLQFKSTEEERVMTPMEDSRSQVCGCFFLFPLSL